ncbi:MAG: heavy-metal-associated domain-containing protein [Dermatophilaceae bacterium]
MSTQTFRVDGLTCDHCVHAVTTELTALHGVNDVRVELVVGGTSTVHVEADRALSDVDIMTALDEAGDYVLAGA